MTLNKPLGEMLRRMSSASENLVELNNELSELYGSLESYLNKTQDLEEDKFQAIFENTAVGIALVYDEKPEYTNKSFQETVGYTGEELAQLSFADFTHPDDAQLDLNLYGQLLRKEIPSYSITKRYIHKNGSIVWVDLSVTLMRNSQGEPTYAVGVIRDITKMKKAEAALAIKDNLFQAVFNQTFQFIGVLNKKGILLEANDTALDFGGFSREQVVGRAFDKAPWWSLSAKTQEKLRQSIKKSAKGEFIRYEVDVVGGQEQVIRIDFSLKPIKNEKGKVTQLIAEGRDITYQKELLDKVSTEQQKMALFVKHTPAAIAMFDNELHYLVASDLWYKAYSLTEEVIGKHHYDVFPEIRALPEWMEIHQRCLRGHTFKRENEQFVRTDGSIMYLTYEIRPWQESNGEIGGIIMFTQDVTEEFKLKRQLKRLNQDLEKKVAERTRDLESFSYSVSHDLRAPLRALQGFSKNLLERYNGQLDDTGERWLGYIEHNAARMDQLIKDILAYSRIGRSEMSYVAVDLKALVETVWRELAPYHTESNPALELEGLGEIYCDYRMMKQVWDNLVGNALKYSSSREKAIIKISQKDMEDHHELTISDNGVGFDQAYADKLFGVFQRLHSEREFNGTGVGLAIVKSLIEKHGGRIYGQGEIDKGATFKLRIPKNHERSDH